VGNKKRIYDALFELYGNYIITDSYVKKWVTTVYETLEIHDNGFDTLRVLELAAGTGRFAERFVSMFQERIEEYVATDISYGMLHYTYNAEKKKLFSRIVCDMRDLPIKTKYNVIISNFDSINYLVTEQDLKKCFQQVKLSLSDNGVFVFDYALIEVGNSYAVGNSGRAMESRNFKVLQESEFDTETRTIKNTFFFTDKMGRESDFYEEHIESFFTISEIKRFLHESGLKAIKVYNFIPHLGHNSHRAGAETDQRVQFVVTHS